MLTLVIGGARSGKSAFAERFAAHYSRSGIYIATAIPFDLEMRKRIDRHRQDRTRSGFEWMTIEEPVELSSQIQSLREPDKMILIDCLTIWLSNCILSEEQQKDETWVSRKIDELLETLQTHNGHLIAVTNEVGAGIVPDSPLGRQFRDVAGRLNRKIAACSDQVFLVTAGIPVELKQLQFKWPTAPGIETDS